MKIPKLQNSLSFKYALIWIFLFTFFSNQVVLAEFKIDSTIVEVKIRSKKDDKIIFSDWQEFTTNTVTQFKNQLSDQIIATNNYGSNLGLKFTSTGFYHTQKSNDRWWVIDPEGYAGLQIAVNSVDMGKSDLNQNKFKSVFGSEVSWMETTGKLLQNNGFNGTGSWSNIESIREWNKKAAKPISYSVMLNFMSQYGSKRGGTSQQAGHKGYPNNTIFVFDPGFEEMCDKIASDLEKYKNDKNLFGYFTDNELPFNVKNLEDYLALPKNDFGYLAAKKWIDDRNIKENEINAKHKAEFLGFVADTYFSIVTKSIKKYDPNHLCLGSRFYSSEKNVKEFMQASGKYIDVVSINYYNTWTPSQSSMKNWEKWSGKPIIITEFYVKAEDSGLGNLSGAGWLVKTQNDRGLFYQNYCLGLLQSKVCIGWHWFKYQDNDPTYAKSDPSNNDANKGILDNNYNIYQPMLDKMKELNDNRFKIIELFNNLSHE